MAEKKPAKKPATKKTSSKSSKPVAKKQTTKKSAEVKKPVEKKPVTKKPVEKPEETEKKIEEKTEKVSGNKKWSTKKKVIFWSCLGGGLLVAIVVAVVLIIIFTRVDYNGAYTVAEELKTELTDLKTSACSNVTSYANSSYTTEKEYAKYIEKCKDSTSGVGDLVARLEENTAIQRDEKINRQWKKFKKEYDEVIGDSEKKDQALKLYETWHKWILASDKVNEYDEPDAELEETAKILTESGNDELKEYGETWLKYKKELASTYRTYRDTSFSAENYDAVYDAYSKARNDYSNWLYKNSIKISDVADWKANSYSDLSSEFSELYDLIKEAAQGVEGGADSSLEKMIRNGGASDGSSSGDYNDILKMLGQ